MVHTNLNASPQKKATGIIINEGGSCSSQKIKQDLPPGDKGKRKKNFARKGTNVEPTLSKPKDEQPLINQREELRARNQPTATATLSAATPPTTKSVPTPAPPQAAPALPVAPPPPSLLNRLKEQFTRQRGTYIPFWVLEFYLAYGELVPKNKKKASEFRLVKSVMVSGKEVKCHSKHINVVLGRQLRSVLPNQGLPTTQSPDDLKGWLALMISNTTPSIPKAACVGSIMARRQIDLGLFVSQEIAIRAKQTQTYLPFPFLVTELCRHAGVPRDPASDIEVTPSSSIYIRRIEAEFTREEDDRKLAAPANNSPEVNIDLLSAETPSSTPASEPSGILAPSSSSSKAPGASSSS
uniref:Putative plant transposon protein domain-containing protein n=1 Tax=Solanum tuberosum TaxID=4113 RepID=M1DAJ7_SOLTU